MFNFFTKLLANLSKARPLSEFPNEIKILKLTESSFIPIVFLDTFLKVHSIKSNAGPVMNVVTNAIMTIIAKISGVRIPKSYPMFNTTSSISPLVFINAPIINESFQFCPTNLEARALPMNLPATATKIMTPVIFHR